MKSKLGINIDHIATLRNARGEDHPNLLKAANIAIKNGADSITIHVREDQRHVKKKDAIILKKRISKPINLEMAPTCDMTNFAIKLKPKYVCIVPEKRKEITTEGGLNLKQKNLQSIIKKLKKNKIEVSLFVNPKVKDVISANKMGVDAVELHTGSFANAVKSQQLQKINFELKKIINCKLACDKTKMKFNLGHGLNYKCISYLKNIKNINEYNIGHFIIGESIFDSFSKVIKKIKKMIN